MRLKFSGGGGRPGAGGFTSRLKGIESGVNHFSRPDFCMSDNFFVCNAGVAMGTIGYSPRLIFGDGCQIFDNHGFSAFIACKFEHFNVLNISLAPLYNSESKRH